MKIVFFFGYIHTQKDNSLMYQFLMAQKQEPKKGDWYSDVNKYLKKFKIDISEEAI